MCGRSTRIEDEDCSDAAVKHGQGLNKVGSIGGGWGVGMSP